MNETLSKVIDVAKTATTEPVMKVVNQRLSNPFFLCFISSWIICNWDRVLLVLFAFNLSMEQRIDKLKSLPSNSVFFDVSISHTHTFWYPFFASIMFVIGSPFVSYVVDIIQNGVIGRINKNDSLRKQEGLELKKAEIIKNVEYENADAQARLTVEKQNKQIQLDIRSHEKNYEELTIKLKDINSSIKEREKELLLQNESYNNVLISISEVRRELDEKEQELKGLNSKIITQQNKLDSISSQISKTSLGTSSSLDEISSDKSAFSIPQTNVTWPPEGLASMQTAADLAKNIASYTAGQPNFTWPKDNLASMGAAAELAKSLASFNAGQPKVTWPVEHLESLKASASAATLENLAKNIESLRVVQPAATWPLDSSGRLNNTRNINENMPSSSLLYQAGKSTEKDFGNEKKSDATEKSNNPSEGEGDDKSKK